MLKSPSSTYNFSIKSYEADRNGKLSLHTFFHYLQECAYLNALSNGFGYEFLERENAYWVLTRVLVEIEDLPKWNDEIQIRTWPRGADGLFAVGDLGLSKASLVIGRVSSYWMILDRDSRRPKRIDQYQFIRSDFIPDKAIERKLEKIPLGDNSVEIGKRRVYASDIDVNGHVNNASYVRWLIDSFSENHHAKVKSFEINFLRELVLGDQFTILEEMQDSTYLYLIVNDKGQKVCLAKIQ
jgi:acyl-ACP thioesterase